MNITENTGDPTVAFSPATGLDPCTPYAFERVHREGGGAEVARLEAQNLLLEKSHPLAQLPPIPASGAILDVGSGTGFWAIRLAARIPIGRITCLDRSGELLDLARQRLQAAVTTPAEFLQQDLRALNLPTQAYDLVFTCVTLAHVPRLEPVLGPLVDALKPGGWLVCFEPFQQSRSFCEVYPPCPNLQFILEGVATEARERGSDLSLSLKLVHFLDRMGMGSCALRDFGSALHGADAAAMINQVMLPLAKSYLGSTLSPEELAHRLGLAAKEGDQPHLWLDCRRAVTMARKPFS
jgi:SAM-dependent methyltransferase